jgi:hypothetical protein
MSKVAPLEETSSSYEAASGIQGGSGEKIPFSWELLKCVDRAVVNAQRMRSDLVQPEHLLAGVLQNERIRNALAPWLAAPEALVKPGVIAGFGEDEQTRSDSCPFCGRSVQGHWKHCVYCGKSLARVCPKCGAAQPEIEDAYFCFECGSPLKRENVSQAVPPEVLSKAEIPGTGIKFSLGQQVRVINGPFTEYVGTIAAIDMDHYKLTVLISFFGRETAVVLDFLQVENI